MKFFLLLLLIPLAEVAVFIEVGDEIGAMWTILLTVGTAILGAALVRAQGIRTLLSAREQLSHGELPAAALVEGMILLMCGAMLLTPGFITDTLGFLGLIPAVRHSLAANVVNRVMVAQVRKHHHQNGSSHVIEGEYRRED